MLSHSYFVVCFTALAFLSTSTAAAPLCADSAASADAVLDPRCQDVQDCPESAPLEYCPKGTVFVSQRHPAAGHATINSALASLPDDGTLRTILIDAGEYNEKVVVDRVSPTVFAGVTRDRHADEANRVVVWQSTYVNQSDPTSTLHNCDAVVLGVGTSSVGSTDFKAYNIDFVQRQVFGGEEVTDRQLGPAAALCVERSNASFYGCGFASYQDTLYVGPNSQAFFFASMVKGMTDQLYGMGTAWLERVQLLSRGCIGGITAWRGDPVNPLVGVYISNSTIERSDDAPAGKNLTGKCHLGRPWNVYAHATYLNTTMSDIIAPEGFKTWTKEQTNFDPRLTRFAEYTSSGPGADPRGRNKTLERMLSDQEASQITWTSVFGGSAPWIDARTVHSW